MRGLLTELDGAFRAVRHRQASVVFPAGRHDAVAEDHPVSLLVIAEQVRRPVVTPTMALAARGVDMQLHCVTPVDCVTSPDGPASARRATGLAGATAAMTRLSSA